MNEGLYAIGLWAVAVNAATGVLEAGRKSIDLFGMVVVALAAALGGTLYAAAAWAGALLRVASNHFGMDANASAALAIVAVLALRLVAIRWRIRLPIFIAKR